MIAKGTKLAAFAAFLSSAGCPGTLDDPSRFLGPDCGDVEAELLVPRCGTLSGCHIADAPAALLDLQSPNLAERVVNVPATITCGGGLLADPAHPQSSILYQKVADDVPCGSRMPLGSADLTLDEQSCILLWIAAQTP